MLTSMLLVTTASQDYLLIVGPAALLVRDPKPVNHLQNRRYLNHESDSPGACIDAGSRYGFCHFSYLQVWIQIEPQVES